MEDLWRNRSSMLASKVSMKGVSSREALSQVMPTSRKRAVDRAFRSMFVSNMPSERSLFLVALRASFNVTVVLPIMALLVVLTMTRVSCCVRCDFGDRWLTSVQVRKDKQIRTIASCIHRRLEYEGSMTGCGQVSGAPNLVHDGVHRCRSSLRPTQE